MKKKISVEDRERIENRLREMEEQKNLKEIHKHREDDKWDIVICLNSILSDVIFPNGNI